ncbi:MAG: hypothetical protein R3C49_06765 [Planctomycetaceae bacterium]
MWRRLCDSDIGTGHSNGRTISGEQCSFVAQEFDHVTEIVHQSNGFVVILDPVGRQRDERGAESSTLICENPGQVFCAINASAIAVVKLDLPSRKVGSSQTGDLDAFSESVPALS